jgi:hypothetical protein
MKVKTLEPTEIGEVSQQRELKFVLCIRLSDEPLQVPNYPDVAQFVGIECDRDGTPVVGAFFS